MNVGFTRCKFNLHEMFSKNLQVTKNEISKTVLSQQWIITAKRSTGAGSSSSSQDSFTSSSSKSSSSQFFLGSSFLRIGATTASSSEINYKKFFTFEKTKGYIYLGKYKSHVQTKMRILYIMDRMSNMY